MTLLLDIGNSRVKYRTADGPMAAVLHHGKPAEVVERIAQHAERVAVVDVTGTAATVLAAHNPILLTPTASACGVINAYANPGQLGADRWAALIGARALTHNACCIIDVGSAITADVLSPDGKHLGGWIAPGLQLQVAALAGGTRYARSPTAGAGTDTPAVNTADAIHGGALHALVGFALRARESAAAALGSEPELLVCGGDADLVATAVGGRIVDDLVLRGLAAWVAAQ